MNKVIVLVTGAIGSGKDTFSKCLKNYGFYKISIAQSLKSQVSKENNIPIKDLYIRETKEIHRPLIVKTAFETKKQFGDNYYIDKTINYMKFLNKDKYVISDFRFTNEFFRCKEYFPEYRIIPVQMIKDKCRNDSHLADFPIPFYIQNNGTRENLEVIAHEFNRVVTSIRLQN